MFKNINGIKISIFNKNIKEAMQIPVNIYQRTKKLFVTVQPANTCKLEFLDHLWPPFLDQHQSYILLFEIITFHVYNILVKKMETLNMS